MPANGPTSYSINLSKAAVWKLIAVMLVATAAVVAIALWLPSLAGEQAAMPQPSVLWRAGNFGLIAVLAALGYRLTAGPRARAWRIPVAVLAVALVFGAWRTLGLSVTEYNARWGTAETVVGDASELLQRQRRSRSGAVTITQRFTLTPEGENARPLRIETRQPLASVLAEHPRVRIDLRRSWAGISFDALRPCVQAGSDCDALPATVR